MEVINESKKQNCNSIEQFKNLNTMELKYDEIMLLRIILQEKTPEAQHACSLLKDIAK